MSDQAAHFTKDMVPAGGSENLATPEQQKLDDESVQFINSTIQETLYKGAITIGRYLFEKYFDNDPELASSRNPKKASSFQRLCEHPGLKVDPTTLSRMVRVAVQENYLEANDINLGQIGYTHRLSLLRITDEQKKIAFAQKCIEQSLSTRQFNELIDKELEGEPDDQNEALRNPVKFVARVDKFLEDSRKIATLKSGITLNKLRPSTREKLKKEAESLVAHMQEITRECNELIQAITHYRVEPAKGKKLKK